MASVDEIDDAHIGLGGVLAVQTSSVLLKCSHLAPENLAVAASRLDSVLAGYDLATRDTK